MARDLLEVGRIVKAHGLRGQVIVDFITERDERRRPGTVFDTDRGPMTLLDVSAHQHRWIVTFDGVGDRNDADALRGVVLRAEALEPLDDEVYLEELLGKRVVDSDGIDRGEIVGMEGNPAADLVVLDDGHVVPLTFVTDIGDDRIVVDTPDGLFDL